MAGSGPATLVCSTTMATSISSTG
ncbi:UNVERIFIED_CONTAM: hypothetical protein GTU68_044365 [Idotea baltica]|nr:hypothetical protein [Idotea baltica]